mgnify:CR=1 FL=1
MEKELADVPAMDKMFCILGLDIEANEKPPEVAVLSFVVLQPKEIISADFFWQMSFDHRLYCFKSKSQYSGLEAICGISSFLLSEMSFRINWEILA